MDHAWVEKIVTGLIVLGVVAIAILRAGASTAVLAALGQFQVSRIPARLRRFLFGERNAHTN
jgi:hypothetical protein